MGQTLAILRDSKAQEWGDGNNYALQKRIEYAIIAARATIIQRRYDSTGIMPVQYVERAKCKDIIIVDEDECPCGCDGKKSVRSKNKIPKPLVTKDGLVTYFVGRGFKPFSYVPFHQVHEIKYRPFSSKEIFYTYLDEYLYFINANVLSEFDTAYVPENIVDFLAFGQCTNSACILDGEVVFEDSLVEGINALLEARRPQLVTGKEDTEITLND